jgi:hypothetical protein
MACAEAIGGSVKKRMTQFAGALLEIGRIGAEAIGTLDDEFQSEPTAHLADETLVAIRFRSAQAMVQMRRGEPRTETMSDRVQRVCERDRIGAARKTKQNEFALSYRNSCQRGRDRVDDARDGSPFCSGHNKKDCIP